MNIPTTPYDTVVPTRPRSTTPADLHRLADQAKAKGVRLLTEGATGERFAASVSRPGTIHRLTAVSCSCEGFTFLGRCQHHSMLVAELGWLPDVAGDDPAPPSPAAPAMAPCYECHGTGAERVAMAGRWFTVACLACDGTGALADEADDRGDDLAEGAADDHTRRSAMARPVAVCEVCHGRGFDPVCGGHPTAAGRVWCECARCGGRTPAMPAPRPIVAVDVDRWPLAA